MHLIPSWAPNVHPLIIHFPIVLVLLAMTVDLARLVRPQAVSGNLAVALYLLGAISALVAFLSGSAAADTVFTPGMAPALVADHRRWALITTSALGGVGGLRLGARVAGRGDSRADRVIFVTVSVALSILVQQTAERGARLVYQQGVGVVARPGPDAPATPAADRSGADGPR